MKNAEKFSATELAVLQHLFAAIPEEMGALLGRSAFSSNIKERRDYSCALFNASGDLLAQAAHIPVHLGAMPRSVEAVLQDFPSLAPGDVVMLNDPFRGGSHLPDITLVSPLFLSGSADPSGYAATRAHHADVGGMSPGSLVVGAGCLVALWQVVFEATRLAKRAGRGVRRLRERRADK